MLLDFQEQMQERISKISDAQTREAAAKHLNAKRTMYLEAAESIVRRISKHITTSEYLVLAQELLNDVDFSRAERYFQRAVEASNALTIQRIVALRSLGGFYFAPGPSRDVEKASRQFQLATEQLSNPSDPYSIFTQGVTYELWGLSMLLQGFKVEGTRLVDRARKYYEDLPSTFPWRQSSLELLPNKVAAALAGHLPSPAGTTTPEL